MFLISILILLISLDNSYSKPIFVFQLFRHGSRAPEILRNGRDGFGTKWNIPAGALTKSGERMEYLEGVYMGQKLRKDGLINEYWDPSTFLIWCTTNNRTLQSAYSQMLGLFPKSFNLSDNQTHIALPPNTVVTSFPQSTIESLTPLPDSIQAFPVIETTVGSYFNLEADCYGKGQDLIDNATNYKDLQAELAEFDKELEPINKALHDKLNYTDDVFKNFQLYQELFCDTFVSLDFEGRVHELDFLGLNLTQMNETMKKCNRFNFKVYDHDRNFSRTVVSPWAVKIIEFMDKKLNGTETLNVFFYSAHDSTIYLFVDYIKVAFNVEFLTHNIYFTSNFMIELTQDNGKNEITVTYNEKLIMKTDYDSFRKSFLNYARSRDEIDQYCSINNQNGPAFMKNSMKIQNFDEIVEQKSNDSMKYIILIIAITVLIAVLGGIICYLAINMRKGKLDRTQLLENSEALKI